MKLLSMHIIFAKETICPSLAWPTPDASQKIASKHMENIKRLVKLLVLDQMS